MPDHEVVCEVFEMESGAECCPGSAKMRKGQSFALGAKTPEPDGVCARAFMSIYPVALARRFSDEIPWERGKGHFDVKCPDGCVVFRLSRLKSTPKG